MITTEQVNEYASLLHDADAFSGQEGTHLRNEGYGLKNGFYTGPSFIKDKARELADLACEIGGETTFMKRRHAYDFFLNLIIALAIDGDLDTDERDLNKDASTLAAIFE